MEEKPNAGVPPTEPPKPKTSNLTNIEFSYFDLFETLVTTDIIENQRFLIFAFNEHIIKIKEFEFYSFLNRSFETEEILLTEGKEGMLLSTPEFKEEKPLHPSLIIDVETKKETEIPTYICYNIVENSKLIIFENEE